MSGDRGLELAFLAIALILPLSALIARRMPAGRTLRLVLIWAAIIGGLALAITAVTSRETLQHFT